MKSYDVRDLILKTMDINTNHMNAYAYAKHVCLLANLRRFLNDKNNTAIVVIESKDTCLLLQDQKWTIANTSTDAKDEIIGFKHKSEVTIADMNMFAIVYR